MIGAIGLDLSSLAAIGVLLGSAGGAFTGARMLGPNRGRVIQQSAASERESWRAALDTALEHYEADNVRLREALDELDAKFERCAAERDELRARMSRMLARFDELGVTAPD